MFPSNTSSIDGCSAAVTETESPSQLSPAVNQRMCTSLTPDGADLESEAMPSTPLDQYFFDVLPLQIYRHKKYGEFGTHSGREMPFSGNERPHGGNVRRQGGSCHHRNRENQLRCIFNSVGMFQFEAEARPGTVWDQEPVHRFEHLVEENVFNPNVVVEVLQMTGCRNSATQVSMNRGSRMRGER